jgi:hypothetical protein
MYLVIKVTAMFWIYFNFLSFGNNIFYDVIDKQNLSISLSESCQLPSQRNAFLCLAAEKIGRNVKRKA